MASLERGSVVVAASADAIRAMIHDPDVLRRILPGCESLDPSGPGSYLAVLAVRIQFMTIRADVAASIDDGDGQGPVRLTMAGRPRGLVGSFTVDVPFELEADAGGTRITYDIDLAVTGRLAAFGALILRDTTRRQIAELVRNVEREAARGDAS